MGLVEEANETLCLYPLLIRLSNFGRAELVLELEPLVAAKAKERQIAGLKQSHTVPESSQERCGEASETLAQIAGVSSNTIRRVKL